MSNFNPYHAPSAILPTGKYAGQEGMWREGKRLLMTKGAEFPDRCVKCNAPAEGYRLKRDLSWHTPWLYLLIFFPGLLVYVIVALIVRDTAKIYVPLCPRHRSARRNAITFGWLGSLAGIAMIIGAGVMSDSLPEAYTVPMVVGGLVLLLLSMVLGAIFSRVVTPSKIDKTMVWLKDISPEFLDSLPDSTTYAANPFMEPDRPKGWANDVLEDFREV